MTDPLMNVTLAEQDALGRAVSVTDAAMAVTSYTYGPFGDPYTVTAPGARSRRRRATPSAASGSSTIPTRAPPPPMHDGFGELISSTDALGRMVTFTYDALGRTESRLDQDSGQSLTTSWTWDTAPHGIGKLAQLTSPDGQKTYSYTPLGQLNTISLAVNGESDVLQATLGYDPSSGLVKTITYPTPAGAAAVRGDPELRRLRPHAQRDRQRHEAPLLEAHGRWTTPAATRPRCSATASPPRGAYYADKQNLESIVTESGATPVQNLAYDYDVRRDLTSRTDTLQPQNTTERFRYDPAGTADLRVLLRHRERHGAVRA